MYSTTVRSVEVSIHKTIKVTTSSRNHYYLSAYSTKPYISETKSEQTLMRVKPTLYNPTESLSVAYRTGLFCAFEWISEQGQYILCNPRIHPRETILTVHAWRYSGQIRSIFFSLVDPDPRVQFPSPPRVCSRSWKSWLNAIISILGSIGPQRRDYGCSDDIFCCEGSPEQLLCKQLTIHLCGNDSNHCWPKWGYRYPQQLDSNNESSSTHIAIQYFLLYGGRIEKHSSLSGYL